jgi:hypothetical protein
MMPYLFLSYAKADRDTAFAMRDVLRNEGFLVWMNENADEPYNHQWKEIEANISNAGAFVVLMSDEAKKSDWVRRELQFAKEKQRLILPILIQGEAWEGFAEQAIPLHVGLRLDIPDERIAEIKNQLKNYPDSALPNPLPDASIEARQQRNVLITSALIVLFIIVVFRLALYFQNMDIEQRERATSAAVTQEILQITEIELQLTELQNQQVATETAEAEFAVHATASHVALWNILAPNSNINREANLTRQARNLEVNRTQQAQIREENNRTATAAAIPNISALEATFTAIFRTPCGARTIASENESFALYSYPSFDSEVSATFPTNGEQVFLNIIMVTSDTERRWYYVSVEGRSEIGYLPEEVIELEENCPR